MTLYLAECSACGYRLTRRGRPVTDGERAAHAAHWTDHNGYTVARPCDGPMVSLMQRTRPEALALMAAIRYEVTP